MEYYMEEFNFLVSRNNSHKFLVTANAQPYPNNPPGEDIQEDVKDVVIRCLDRLGTDIAKSQKGTSNIAVHIVIDKGKCTIKSGKFSTQIDIPFEEVREKDEWKVRQITFKSSARDFVIRDSRIKNWKKFYNSTLAKIKPKYKNFLLLPFIWLGNKIRYMRTSVESFEAKTAAEKLNQLLQQRQPKNLEDFIGLVRRQLQHLDPGSDDYRMMSNAVINGENARKGIAQGKLDEVIKDCIDKCIASSEPFMIPSGYYSEDGKFHPVIYTIKKRGDNEVTVSSLEIDDKEGKNLIQEWNLSAQATIDQAKAAAEKAKNAATRSAGAAEAAAARAAEAAAPLQRMQPPVPLEAAAAALPGEAAAAPAAPHPAGVAVPSAAPPPVDIAAAPAAAVAAPPEAPAAVPPAIPAALPEEAGAPAIAPETVLRDVILKRVFELILKPVAPYSPKTQDEQLKVFADSTIGLNITAPLEQAEGRHQLKKTSPLENMDLGLKALGATQLEVPGSSHVKPKDALELCWAALDSVQSKDLSKRDKITFLISAINEEIDLLIQGIEHLNPTEKLAVLRDLDARLSKLKIRIRKVMGDDQAYDLLLDSELFKNLKDKLNKYEAIRHKFNPSAPPAVAATAQATTVAPVFSKENVEELELGKTLMSPAGSVAAVQTDIFIQHSAKLERLSLLFSQNNAEEALKVYRELTKALDDLVAEGQYEDARRLAIHLQQLLPVPRVSREGVEPSFWSQLAEFPANPVEQQQKWQKLNEWSSLTEKVTHCHWEAYMKLHCAHVNPVELVSLMNSKAVLTKLARCKSAFVKSKFNPEMLAAFNAVKGKIVDACNAKLPEGTPSQLGTSPEIMAFFKSLKDLGITYEEASCLAFDFFQPNKEVFLSFLKHDPFIRVAAFPGLLDKVQQLEAYFADSSEIGMPSTGEVALDSNVNRKLKSDNNYLTLLEIVARSFGKCSAGSAESTLVEMSLEYQSGKAKFLPAEIVNLRRHTVMSQIMFRPQQTLALNFGDAADAIVWLQKLLNQATKDTVEQPSKKNERAKELAYQELEDVLDTRMTGRLDIQGDKYLIEGTTAVITNTANRERVNYLPYGFGHSTLDDLLERSNSPLQAQDLAPIPKKYLDVVGERDQDKYFGYQEANYFDKVLPNPLMIGSRNNIQGFTEEGLLKLSLLQQAEIGVVEDYMLRTLSVSPGARSLINTSDSKIMEALYLICACPGIVSNPQVRSLLDLIFTETSQFDHLFLSNNDFLIFKNYMVRLQSVIQTQLDAGQLETAGFLIHLAQRPYAFMFRVEKEISGIKAEFAEKESSGQDFDVFGDDVEKSTKLASKVGMRDYLKKSMELGRDNVDKLMNKAREVKKLDVVKQFQIEIDMFEHPTSDAVKTWLGTLNAVQIKELLQYKNHIQSCPESKITPFVRMGMLKWIDEVLNPTLITFLNQNQNEEIRNDVLTQLAKAAHPTIGAGTRWKLKDEKTSFIYRDESNKYTINLLESPVDVSFDIPDKVFERFPELKGLVATCKNFKCKRGNNKGELVFSFIASDKSSYEVHYIETTGQMILCRAFSIEGGKARWYQKISPEETSFDGAAIARDLGMWIDIDNPQKGIVLSDSLPHKFPFNRIEIDLNEDGTFNKGYIREDGHKFEIDFSSKEYTKGFPFATSSHCIYIPEKQQLFFLDKGMVAKRVDDHWEIEHPSRLASSTTKPRTETATEGSKRAEHIAKTLGPEIAMHLHSASSDRILMWPLQISRSATGAVSVAPITSLTESSELPLIEVSFNEDGKPESSAAGFMYMAYALMQKRDYALAHKMLVLAQNSRLETSSDKELFAHIAAIIRKENPKTTRSIVFQLTAEVALIEIEKQQLAQNFFSPAARTAYFEHVQRLSKMYGDYTNRHQEGARLDAHGYRLSPEINEKCLAFRRECFASVLSEARVDASLAGIPYTFKAVEPMDFSAEVISHIATYAEFLDPGEKIPPKVSPLTGEHVLKYFCYYYNLLVSGELLIDDAPFLFDTLAEKIDQSAMQAGEKQMISAAEVAQRMLIQVGLYRKEMSKNSNIQRKFANQGNIKIDIEALRAGRGDILKKKLMFTKNDMKMKKIALENIWKYKSIEKGLEKTQEIVKAHVEKDPAAFKFMEKIFNPVSQGVFIENAREVNQDLLSPKGFVSSKKELQKIPPQGPNQFNIAQALANLEKIKQDMGLSELETLALKKGLEELRDKGQIYCDLRVMLEMAEMQGDLSLIELRREQELRSTIQKQEGEAIKQSQGQVKVNYTSEKLNSSLVQFGGLFVLDQFYELPKPEQEPQPGVSQPEHPQERITKTIVQLKETFTSSPLASSAEAAENRSMLQGVDGLTNLRVIPEARVNRQFSRDGIRTLSTIVSCQLEDKISKENFIRLSSIKVQNTASIKEMLKNILYQGTAEYENSRSKLFDIIFDSRDPKLREMIENLSDQYTKDQVVDELFRLYISGELALDQLGIEKITSQAAIVKMIDAVLTQANAVQRFADSKERLLEIAGKSHIPSLRKMVNEPLLYSSDEVINELLQLYQTGDPSVAEYEPLITSFLLWGTSVQQLRNADNILKKIKEATDPEIIQEESRKLSLILTENLQTARYLDNDGKIKDPQMSRKFLVAEYRMGIVLQKGQRETIKAICQDPKQLLSLRMGEGKTFIIMPVVAAVLGDTYLPITLSPPQLESLSQSESDRTTSKIFGKRAHSLRLDLNKTSSAAYLAGVYSDLLNARKKRDYNTCSVPTLASIQSLTTLLREERAQLLEDIRIKARDAKKSVSEFLEDPKGIPLGLKLKDLNRRLYWARKILRLLDGELDQKGKAPHQLPTILFGDEVDSICHISKEINRALGDPVPIDKDIRHIGSSIFNALLTWNFEDSYTWQKLTPEEIDNLKAFKKAIINGTLSTLQPLKSEYLVPLAKLLLLNPRFRELLPESVQKDKDITNLANYLVGLSSERPDSAIWDDDAPEDSIIMKQQKSLAALKHFLSITLESICSGEGGLRFKLDEDRGCLVVPVDQGREDRGNKDTGVIENRFGDEYELVAFQYLAHIQINKTQAKSGKTADFYAAALRTCEDKNKDLFNAIKDTCFKGKPFTGRDIYEAMAEIIISTPELWAERMKLMDLQVFEGGMITRAGESITIPASSVASGRDFGGLTGTLNPYSLPGFKASSEEEVNVFKPTKPSARQVEVETFFKAALNNPNQLNEKVDVLHDTDQVALRDDLREIMNSNKTVAIVNEGGYGLEGKSVEDWVRELRSLFRGERRDLGWANETADGVTHYYLWEKSENNFREVTKSELEKHNFIGLYAPQFTRGTDLPLRSGDVHYFPGRTTNPQDAGQSIWRGRGTGGRHTTKFHVPMSVMPEGEVWTIGETYRWITDRGLREQLPLNLKAQTLRITEMSACPLRQFQNSFSDVELDDTFESVNKDNAATAYAYMVAEDHLNSHFRDYFIKTKAVNFKADLEPSRQERTFRVMNERFDQEIHKAQQKQDELPGIMLNTFEQLAADAGMTDKIFEFSSKLLTGEADQPGLLTRIGIDRSYLPMFFVDLYDDPNDRDKSQAQRLENIKKNPLFAEKFALLELGTKPGATEEQQKAATTAFASLLTHLMFKDFLHSFATIQDQPDRTPLSDAERLEQALSKAKVMTGNRLYEAAFKAKASTGGWLTQTAERHRTTTNVITTIAGALSKVPVPGLQSAAQSVAQLNETTIKNEILRSLTDTLSFPIEARAVMQRFGRAALELQKIGENLKREKGEFREHYEKVHKNFLPATTEPRVSTSGTQEQQQQQQQQQQQEQQQQPSQSLAGKEDRDVEFSKRLNNRYVYLPSAILETPALGLPQGVFTEFQKGKWGVEGVYISNEAIKIFNALPRVSGDPVFKLVVLSTGNLLIISKQDFYTRNSFAKDLNTKAFPLGAKVFDLLPDEDVLVGGGPDVSFSDPVELSIETRKRIAVVKLQLGFNQFNEAELADLRSWWGGLDAATRQTVTLQLNERGFPITQLQQQ